MRLDTWIDAFSGENRLSVKAFLSSVFGIEEEGYNAFTVSLTDNIKLRTVPRTNASLSVDEVIVNASPRRLCLVMDGVLQESPDYIAGSLVRDFGMVQGFIFARYADVIYIRQLNDDLEVFG